MPISRPRTRAHLLLGQREEIAALEEDLRRRRCGPPASATSRMIAERADRLAAAGLADERDGLALAHVPGDTVDRAHDAAARHEVRLEIFNLEEGAHRGRSIARSFVTIAAHPG